MTLSANFTSKSVFDQQDCRALTFALARLSCLDSLQTARIQWLDGDNVKCRLFCNDYNIINVTAIPDKNTTAIASTTSKSSGQFTFFSTVLCTSIYLCMVSINPIYTFLCFDDDGNSAYKKPIYVGLSNNQKLFSAFLKTAMKLHIMQRCNFKYCIPAVKWRRFHLIATSVELCITIRPKTLMQCCRLKLRILGASKDYQTDRQTSCCPIVIVKKVKKHTFSRVPVSVLQT